MPSSNEYLGKQEVVNYDVKKTLTPVCIVSGGLGTKQGSKRGYKQSLERNFFVFCKQRERERERERER